MTQPCLSRLLVLVSNPADIFAAYAHTQDVRCASLGMTRLRRLQLQSARPLRPSPQQSTAPQLPLFRHHWQHRAPPCPSRADLRREAFPAAGLKP
jgi:hypothetical protein